MSRNIFKFLGSDIFRRPHVNNTYNNYNHWSYQYFFLFLKKKETVSVCFFILRPRPFIEKASKIGTFTSNNCFVDFFCENIPNDHTLSSNERNEGRQSFRKDFYQSLTKYFFKLRSTETNKVNFTFFSWKS